MAYTAEEICELCAHAIMHECCRSFCHCRLHQECERNHATGSCTCFELSTRIDFTRFSDLSIMEVIKRHWEHRRVNMFPFVERKPEVCEQCGNPGPAPGVRCSCGRRG